MIVVCCCTGSSCSLPIQVTGCGGNDAPGVVVTVTGPGGFSATCTTGPTGACSITITASGSYTITVDGSSQGLATATRTLTLSCSPPPSTQTFSLSAASGRTCPGSGFGNCCGSRPDAMPESVMLTTNKGSVALAFTSIGGLPGYQGCLVFSGLVCSYVTVDCGGVGPSTQLVLSPVAGSSFAVFTLVCFSADNWQLGVQFAAYNGLTSCSTATPTSHATVYKTGSDCDPSFGYTSCGVDVSGNPQATSNGCFLTGTCDADGIALTGSLPVVYPGNATSLDPVDLSGTVAVSA